MANWKFVETGSEASGEESSDIPERGDFPRPVYKPVRGPEKSDTKAMNIPRGDSVTKEDNDAEVSSPAEDKMKIMDKKMVAGDNNDKR